MAAQLREMQRAWNCVGNAAGAASQYSVEIIFCESLQLDVVTAGFVLPYPATLDSIVCFE